MAKGQKRSNKETKKPKQAKKDPGSTPELFSRGSAPNPGKAKKA